MRNTTSSNLTTLTQDSFNQLPSERLQFIIKTFIAHLHDFAKETHLTHEEWRAGLEFLHKAAAITDESRSEFSLMSDVFGLSSLVDLLAMGSASATPGSNLGPFHSRGSPVMKTPANLLRDNEGQAVVFCGKILDLKGQPIANATVDFWQNADNGLYWQQDPEQPQDNLRCMLQAGSDGSFEIVTIRPKPYTIPMDGPVGALFTQSKRSPWRPAHMHLIVEAPGHKTLVTEIFDEEDPYLDNDAVFGVREVLVAKYQPTKDSGLLERYKHINHLLEVRLDLVLE
jgi:protocatechuate 3,4-dioxygenase beta subunit